MPNYGTYAICPYFSTEDTTAIKCDGIVELKDIDARNVMRFCNKRSKEAWIGKYCESYQYLECPYAAILEGQYNEAGQKRR